MLDISNLVVVRGGGFSLHVPQLRIAAGRVTCVVGANGCGKTTFLETVVGLLNPQRGTIRLDGHTVRRLQSIAAKRMIGFVPDDEEWIIPELTAQEYFALLAALFHKAGVRHDMLHEASSIASTLQFTQGHQQLSSLSHGNRKKVQLIAGLLHKPRLLIVDELRNGLDPIAIKQAERLLEQQRKQGTAILAATHDLWWAERFADEVVMIKSGHILFTDSVRAIVAQSGSVEAKFMELYGSTDE